MTYQDAQAKSERSLVERLKDRFQRLGKGEWRSAPKLFRDAEAKPDPVSVDRFK
ncbi:MAG: hypothetical protein PHV74_11050 [Dehalococcoidia bacterium]|nr:hypothetical protein [Dehalococcoidia bacterium]